VRLPRIPGGTTSGRRGDHTAARRLATYTSSRPSAMRSSEPSNRWPKRSRVTITEEWPMRSSLAFGCAPCPMASATQRSAEGRGTADPRARQP
jgi:hypothetical protein